ncbi:MAG TPA: lysozyme inhibitor LprI family protein [archaeon]|nr:lysozyme inhibitor LprI family protein [archaeon]
MRKLNAMLTPLIRGMNGYIKRSMQLAVLGIGLLALALPVQAASFDCGKAASKVEQMICGDAKLSKLDDEMGNDYQKALSKANEEQKKSLLTEQKLWLKKIRNICTSETCLKDAYSSRLAALATFLAPATPAQGGVWTYRDGAGRNELLCHALLKRLNRYDRNESLNRGCSWNAIASYPEFSEPPWEELDAKKYEDLIAKLEKYWQESPDGYFHRIPGLKDKAPAEVYRNNAKDFIKNGGRLQVWRTKLSSFNPYTLNVKGNHPSANEQTIVRMSGGYPTQPPSKELEKKLSNICKGMPRPDSPGAIFYVTADMRGPDPAVEGGTYGIISGNDLKIYDGKPLLVGSESIWRDSQYGLMGYCDFEFVKGGK